MKRTNLHTKTALLVAVLAVSAGLPAAGMAQVQSADQGRLAARLTHGSKHERVMAILAIRKIPAAERGAGVHAAIVQEIRRYHRRLEARAAALRAGHPPPPEEGEYLFQLLEALIPFHDPADIEPLVLFIGTGNRVMNAIVAFGELAVDSVIDVATSKPKPKPGLGISSALEVLGRMLDRPGPHPLSPASRERITNVAGQRLHGTQGPIVLRHAIQLAIATGSPELRRRVELLARDASEVRALGITEPDLVRRVQSDAMAALERGG